MKPEVRHNEVSQETPPVGVWIGTHPSLSFGSEFSQLRNKPAVLIEQFFCLVAFHPFFQKCDMRWMLAINEEWNLVCSEGTLNL